MQECVKLLLGETCQPDTFGHGPLDEGKTLWMHTQSDVMTLAVLMAGATYGKEYRLCLHRLDGSPGGMASIYDIVYDDRGLILGDGIALVLGEEQLRQLLIGMLLLPVIEALMLTAGKGIDIRDVRQLGETLGKALGRAAIALVPRHTHQHGVLRDGCVLQGFRHGRRCHVDGHAIAILDTVGKRPHALIMVVTEADSP